MSAPFTLSVKITFSVLYSGLLKFSTKKLVSGRILSLLKYTKVLLGNFKYCIMFEGDLK
jgi:hypothetical protein